MCMTLCRVQSQASIEDRSHATMFEPRVNPPDPGPVYAEVKTRSREVLFMHSEFLFCTIML